MKTSTILVVSTLVLGGAGAYFYFKGKKTKASDTTATAPTNTTTTAPTLPTTDDKKLLQDLGVKVEEPKPTPYVAPSVPVPTVTMENIQKALLSLGIDQTRSVNELSSPNYIEAKKISDKIKEINKVASEGRRGVQYAHSGCNYTYDKYDLKTLSTLYGQTVTQYCGTLKPKLVDIIAIFTKKINELGYKVLPNYDIEKM